MEYALWLRSLFGFLGDFRALEGLEALPAYVLPAETASWAHSRPSVRRDCRWERARTACPAVDSETSTEAGLLE